MQRVASQPSPELGRETGGPELEAALKESSATRVSGLLRAVRPGPDARATAELIIRHLEAGSFDQVLDDQAVSCRADAVEALLRLGYPYALAVTPEELALARRRHAERPRTGRALMGAGLAVLGGLVGLGLALWSPPPAPVPAATVAPANVLDRVPTRATVDGVALTVPAEVYVSPEGLGTVRAAALTSTPVRGGLPIDALDLYSDRGERLGTLTDGTKMRVESATRRWNRTFETPVGAGGFVVVLQTHDRNGTTVRVQSGPIPPRMTSVTVGGSVVTPGTATVRWSAEGLWVEGTVRAGDAQVRSVRLIAEGAPSVEVPIDPVRVPLTQDSAFLAQLPTPYAQVDYQVALTVRGVDGPVWYQPSKITVEPTTLDVDVPRWDEERWVPAGDAKLHADAELRAHSATLTIVRHGTPRQLEVQWVRLFDENKHLVAESVVSAPSVDPANGGLRVRLDLPPGLQLEPEKRFGMTASVLVDGKPVQVTSPLKTTGW